MHELGKIRPLDRLNQEVDVVRHEAVMEDLGRIELLHAGKAVEEVLKRRLILEQGLAVE